MSVTILGQHIRLIRPERTRMPIIFKQDLPKAKYNKRSKTIKLDQEQLDRIGTVVSSFKN